MAAANGKPILFLGATGTAASPSWTPIRTSSDRQCRQTPSTQVAELRSAGEAAGSLSTDLATSPIDAISPGPRGVSSTTSPECVVILNLQGISPGGLVMNSLSAGRWPPGASVV